MDRRDKGMKREMPLDAATEVGFVKRRRLAVAEATATDAAARRQASGELPLPAIAHDDKYDKEKAFTRQKRFDAFVDSYKMAPSMPTNCQKTCCV